MAGDDNCNDRRLMTLLMIQAIRDGDSSRVETLLEMGVNLNVPNIARQTPLHVALRRGQLEVTKLLIEHGADPNIKDHEGKTSLHLACSYGRLEFAEFLLGNGADVNAKADQGDTPLHWASWEGHMEIVKLKGSHIDPVDDDGWTPLRYALENWYFDVAKLLIAHGSNVNAKKKDGATLLQWACENGHFEITRFLVDSGADVNSTPLVVASERNHLEVVWLLVRQYPWLLCSDRFEPLDVKTFELQTKPQQTTVFVVVESIDMIRWSTRIIIYATWYGSFSLASSGTSVANMLCFMLQECAVD